MLHDACDPRTPLWKELSMRKLFTLLALGVFALSITACNTADGMGEDAEEVGDEIEDAME